jgi:hypothetical protein
VGVVCVLYGRGSASSASGGLVRDGERTIAGREYERRGMCERERARGGVRIRQGAVRAGRQSMGASGECAVGAGPVGAMEAASGADVCGAQSVRPREAGAPIHIWAWGAIPRRTAPPCPEGRAQGSDEFVCSSPTLPAFYAGMLSMNVCVHPLPLPLSFFLFFRPVYRY